MEERRLLPVLGLADLRPRDALSLALHDLLAAACGNRKVVQMHESINRHQRRHQHSAFKRVGRDHWPLDEHAEMEDALRRRDLAVTERRLHAHLVRFNYEIAPLLSVSSDPELR